MSFVLVASVKALEGRLYRRGAVATVATTWATLVEPVASAGARPVESRPQGLLDRAEL